MIFWDAPHNKMGVPYGDLLLVDQRLGVRYSIIDASVAALFRVLNSESPRNAAFKCPETRNTVSELAVHMNFTV